MKTYWQGLVERDRGTSSSNPNRTRMRWKSNFGRLIWSGIKLAQNLRIWIRKLLIFKPLAFFFLFPQFFSKSRRQKGVDAFGAPPGVGQLKPPKQTATASFGFPGKCPILENSIERPARTGRAEGIPIA